MERRGAALAAKPWLQGMAEPGVLAGEDCELKTDCSWGRSSLLRCSPARLLRSGSGTFRLLLLGVC